jgi:hypothetical protein
MKTARQQLPRIILLAGLLLSAGALVRAQSTTVQYGAGRLYNGSATLIPDGALVLLLADTQQIGFATLSPGNLNIGDYLNGGLQVLARATVNSAFNGTATAVGTTGAISLGAGAFPQLSTGDALAIVWFPALTGSSFSFVSAASYGLISDPLWLVPAAGSTVTFNFFTVSRGGTYADALAQATFTAIPEPSAYAVAAGFAVLGVTAWRRRAQRYRSSRELRVES